MEKTIFICTAILILSSLLNKLSEKIEFPSYLIYILLGFLFQRTNFFKYDLDFSLISNVCIIAFIFIIFNGSISTSKFKNKKSKMEAILLSTIGTILTALLISVICYYLLNFSYIESFLTGAILSPTDATMVFSHLKNKNFNIKNETIKILKFESASNDTFSYILILFGITILNGLKNSTIPITLLKQIFFSIFFAFLFSELFNHFLCKVKFKSNISFQTIFLSIPAFLYSISSIFGGNGILSVYLFGYYINKNKFTIKISHFLEIISYVFQIFIFFILGMMISYDVLFLVFKNVVLLSLILVFFIRPFIVNLIKIIFKTNLDDSLMISLLGFRGISSIIFGILVYSSCHVFKESIFDTVIFTSIFTTLIQNLALKILTDKSR